MKKSILALMMLASVSCVNEKFQEEKKSVDSVVFKCTIGLSTSDTADDIFRWQADTRAGMSAVSGKETVTNICYAAASSQKTSVFKSYTKEITMDEGKSYDFYSYYPYRTGRNDINAVSADVPAAQTGILDSSDELAGKSLWYASAKGKKSSDNPVELDFKSLFGFLEVRMNTDVELEVRDVTVKCKGEVLAFGNGVCDIVSGTIGKTEDESDEIVYTFFDATTLGKDKDNTIYLVVNPGHAGKVLEVSAGLTDGTSVDFEPVTLTAEGIPAGGMTVVSASYNKPPRPGIDLSAAGTANTYVIGKSGEYKFKATVKGNGQARTYKWNEDGVIIDKSYTEADLQIAPETAALVWFDSPVGKSPVDVESVLFENGYLYFSTPAELVSGNALVAVYDASGEILWSWNIWAVENYDCDAKAVKVGRYTFMDRNLGALAGAEVRDDNDKAALAVGNYYQWGRKDPFPAISSYNDACWGMPAHTPVKKLQKSGKSEQSGETASDLIFTTEVKTNALSLGDKYGTGLTPEQAVEESVRYPYLWMASGSGSDCISASWYKWFDALAPSYSHRPAWRQLWGSVNYTDNEKSIYDPCPPGWKVPTVDAFTGVFNSSAAVYGKGVYNSEYNIYMPYTGQRRAGFGGSQLCDMTVMTYSTATSNNVFPVTSRFGTPINPWNGYTGAGYQLRCVKETVDPITPSTETKTGPRAVLMGDSITEQWATPWDNDRGRVEFFSENDFVGKGISGHSSANMIARFCKDVLDLDPKCVVISAGTNDIGNIDNCYRPYEDAFNNIRLMADLAAASGAKVIIASVLPTWWEFPGITPSRTYADKIIALNKLLKAYAEEKGYPYADYHSVMKDADDNLRVEYSHATNDRVHPNRAGYLVMEKVLLEAVKQAFYDPDAVGGNGQIDDMDKWPWN